MRSKMLVFAIPIEADFWQAAVAYDHGGSQD
jgi:hypothetical protein